MVDIVLLYSDIRKYLKTGGALLDPIVMCDYQLANEDIQKGGGRFQNLTKKSSALIEQRTRKKSMRIAKMFIQIVKMSL